VKWWLCGLLFAATTLNYLDRQLVGILAPTLQREMGFDNAGLGWLFSVFYYSYTFAQFGIGFLLDRGNLRWMYGLAVVAWSLVAALTGLATGLGALIFFRLMLGVAESANWPAALRIVSRALAPEERPLGAGIFTSGTSVGALIAPALVLGISGALGWRWAFAVIGGFGIIWFTAWIIFTRRPALAHIWTLAPEERASAAGGWDFRLLLRSPLFWKVWTVGILVNPCLYFSVNWLPTYFVQERGVSAGAGQLGTILTIIYIGLDLGYLTCGASVMGLVRRGGTLESAKRVVFVTATVLMCLCAAVPAISGLWAAVAVLTVVNFGIGMWIAMYLTMAQEVSLENVSKVAGFLGGSGSLVGALAMWAVGQVTQQTGSFTIPMTGLAVVTLVATAAGLLATQRRPAAVQR
jgi:ACS family hexuronate transporter-like MFS transporter